MSNYNSYMLDGYALTPGDGYSFVSAWFDCKNALAWSVTTTVSGTTAGTLILEASNESDIGSPMGYQQKTSPGTGSTALYVPADQPQQNGLDAVAITGATATLSAKGTTLFDSGLLFNSPPGMRWIRLRYTGTTGDGILVYSSINIKW